MQLTALLLKPQIEGTETLVGIFLSHPYYILGGPCFEDPLYKAWGSCVHRAPRVPVEKLSMNRTVFSSRGTVVPASAAMWGCTSPSSRLGCLMSEILLILSEGLGDLLYSSLLKPIIKTMF